MIGCSFDTPADNATFKANNEYQYALWSDTNKALAMNYGAATSKLFPFPMRRTMILDPYGRWILKYNVSSPGPHTIDVLADMELLLGGVSE